jgi:hypothetical protein
MHAYTHIHTPLVMQAGAKAGGAWVKGTVQHNSLLENQPSSGNPGMASPADPWGSIHVLWDLKDGGSHGKVCGVGVCTCTFAGGVICV